VKKGFVKTVIILVAICLVAALFVVWQKNNIDAVVKTVSKTQEELELEMNEGKKELEEKIKSEFNADIISDLSIEEESKILNGDITVEEAVKNIQKKYEDNKSNSSKQQKSEKETQISEIISDKVVELYSLKAYYLGSLGQMEASAKKDYIALPKDKKNMSGKKEIISKYMGSAIKLLTQCDKKVDGLLKELESEIKKYGGDISIIDQIRSSYENEKALKKAYYVKRLMD
jgi:hypothetical protein